MPYKLTAEDKAILQEIQQQGQDKFSFPYPRTADRFVISFGHTFLVGLPHQILLTWHYARERASKGADIFVLSRRWLLPDSFFVNGAGTIATDFAFGETIKAQHWLAVVDWADKYIGYFARDNRDEINAWIANEEAGLNAEREASRAKRIKTAARAWAEAARGVKDNSPLSQIAALGIIA